MFGANRQGSATCFHFKCFTVVLVQNLLHFARFEFNDISSYDNDWISYDYHFSAPSNSNWALISRWIVAFDGERSLIYHRKSVSGRQKSIICIFLQSKTSFMAIGYADLFKNCVHGRRQPGVCMYGFLHIFDNRFSLVHVISSVAPI